LAGRTSKSYAFRFDGHNGDLVHPNSDSEENWGAACMKRGITIVRIFPSNEGTPKNRDGGEQHGERGTGMVSDNLIPISAGLKSAFPRFFAGHNTQAILDSYFS
jgi:hypothetical protein